MTQEEKSLLLQDLCARLPYGVKVLNTAEGVNEVCVLDSIMTSRKYKDKIFVSLTLPDDSIMTGIEMVKPYLHPMSSMTEEECKTLGNIPATLENRLIEVLPNIPYYIEVAVPDQIDWLNKNGFDYRGLIERGLALEAPEGMYNLNEK